MSDMEPITLKFKMAKPETVTELMAGALRDCAETLGGELVDPFVSAATREIALAFGNAGCVVIQLDNQPQEDT